MVRTNPLSITLFLFFKGWPCDEHDIFLSPNDPPGGILTTKADDNWFPFMSWAGFELTEFLFTEAELSQKKIDKLLELWAATLIPHTDSPPITDHQNLH